ncbi:MAG: hypothetical protein A3D31_06425 [Candidatus Fluviicola riflensis]|nr:MAG: hypothetical protein CHH17_08590 [Candidatus Fluviicola riflensis]OGS79598.1 MAG: hypothetical protein A3D31_06425 [Candidatus Fluviicola riflensis]OGS87029.1 MAG: hypothetical protein A2724_05885 [Fluviicola sp. RIFCSPHIGHO2_01_FULL_43_53]OGS89821.1 MAG: hypothetical protein A3E30_02635 [Fluviicola sp. RIFCSPHIGHO2_12_FULL_43_24]
MKILFLTIGLLALVACGSNETCKDCDKKKDKDTVVVVDDLESAMKRDTITTPSKDQKENHEKIVKKFGEQWDFCTCIVANDSITDAFEKKLTPKQEEKLMARWDYVDKKCKELTTFDNTTPEERAKHEKRVMKCLKENGLKK